MCYVLSHFSGSGLLVTLWTMSLQAPLSMGFSRQEYWSKLPFHSPGDLPNTGIKPASHVSCIGRWVLYHKHCNFNLNKAKISPKHSCILGLSNRKISGGLWLCWNFQASHQYGVFLYCLLELNTWTLNKDITWNVKSPLEAWLLGQVSAAYPRMTPDGFCCKNSLILCQYKLILLQLGLRSATEQFLWEHVLKQWVISLKSHLWLLNFLALVTPSEFYCFYLTLILPWRREMLNVLLSVLSASLVLCGGICSPLWHYQMDWHFKYLQCSVGTNSAKVNHKLLLLWHSKWCVSI